MEDVGLPLCPDPRWHGPGTRVFAPHNSLQLQDVPTTTASLWTIEYRVPKLVARDGSCINCEKPTLNAGEEQSVNHNSQLSAEAWLSLQIQHFGTIKFPIMCKNDCFRSSLDWVELLWMLFIIILTSVLLNTVFLQIKHLKLCSQIWRPFCFRSSISVPPTTMFLDFFLRAPMMFSYSKIPV